jgi:uncharacterized protein YbjT (DUF2867 family)
MLITVTGATGTIGSELVRLLGAAKVPVRAVFRDAHRIRPIPHVTWIQADLREAWTYEPVLAGTTRLFLLSDNAPGFGKQQIDTLRAAESLGVTHVVKLSALGASGHSNSSIAREHYEVEQVMLQSAMSWTLLRPHAFMQNWLGEVAESVRSEGVIYSPIDDGRVPFIDTRDIAAVAAETLLRPEAHAGQKYFLTGREAIGLADLAAALTETTGRTIRYQPISMDAARERWSARGADAQTVGAMLAIAAYQKAGGPTSRVSDRVEKILGHPPKTVREFVRDHARHFLPEQQ